LRSLFGFSYCRKYIRGFSSLAKSLYALTENQTKGKENIRMHLKTWSTYLRRLFLYQERIETHSWYKYVKYWCSFFTNARRKRESHRMPSKTEKNYCVTRQELLAIDDSIKSFAIIYTDKNCWHKRITFC